MKQQSIRCLVVDDEPLAAALISSYVERTPFLESVGEVHDAESALHMVQNQRIDLIFLDIKMPRLSGMQLARLLPKDIRIVFTTAYSDHAVEGFRVGAVDYLLKPVSYDDFMEAALRVQNAIAPAPQTVNVTDTGFLTVKSEYRLLRLPLSDIEYIEGLKDYVKIYMRGENKPILSLMSMKSLEETLPVDRFTRIHRSFIVNIDSVRIIERTGIVIAGRSIPISESYRKAFYARLGIE